MSLRTDETACPFNAQERGYIRRELDLFFGTLPSVADGFPLRTWRSGLLAGQPKLPPALRTMVDGGLMEIRTDTPLPRAYFTERGLGALLERGTSAQTHFRFRHDTADTADTSC